MASGPITRIGIAGIEGRLGSLIASCLAETPDAALSGGTRRGTPPSLHDLAARSDVVIDVTAAHTVRDHASTLAIARRPWVLGTTGLLEADASAVRDASTRIAVLRAANFAPGLQALSEALSRLAAALPGAAWDAEILDLHHRGKADAPSGTALALGDAIARGRGTTLGAVRLPPGAPRAPGGIGFASLRGGSIVGEHSVILSADTEQIILTHRALDRRVFARGAIRAALWLATQPPGLYGMHDVPPKAP